jgi:hypothetical protein
LRNNVQITTIPHTLLGGVYTDLSVTAGNTYRYGVQAFDDAGNISPVNQVSVTVPSSQVSTTTFAVGSRIQTNTSIEVRHKAGNKGRVLGVQEPGARGVIAVGPKSSDGSLWWYVNFDAGVDGWATQSSLAVVASADTSSKLARIVDIMLGSFVAVRDLLRAALGSIWR